MRNFRKQLVEMKAAEPCAIGFWKKKCNFKIEKYKNVCQVTNGHFRLQMLQWKNIYPTNILLSQMKVRKNNKCSYCTDMVHVIQDFCVECPAVQHFGTFVEGTIQWECGINVKYASYRHNVCKAKIMCKRKIKKINIILIAKMSIKYFLRKQTPRFAWL